MEDVFGWCGSVMVVGLSRGVRFWDVVEGGESYWLSMMVVVVGEKHYPCLTLGKGR